MTPVESKRFVILDRDGTIIVHEHYLSDPDKVRLLPGVVDGLRKLKELGLGLVMVTNQSAVGRGLFDESRLALIHDRLNQLLMAEGIKLDGIYYCPHKPEDACDCRKPRVGMVLSASLSSGFDPSDCFVIGDNECDIELGQNIGAITFLTRTGYGSEVETEGVVQPDYVVDNLLQAAQIIESILQGA